MRNAARRRCAVAAAALAGMFVIPTVLGMVPALAEPGDLKQVGGQGPDAATCGTDTGIGTHYSGTGGYGAATYNLHTGMAGLAAAGAGRLFVAAGGVVRDETGIVAGGGTREPDSGPRLPAAEVKLSRMNGIAANVGGTSLWIIEGLPGRVHHVDLGSRTISTVAGAGSLTPDEAEGRPATEIALRDPTAIAADAAGNLYFGDRGWDRVLRIDRLSGTITTVARVTDPGSLAVDALGGQVFVILGQSVVRLDNPGVAYVGGGSTRLVPGGAPIPVHQAKLDRLQALAVDNSVSTDVKARYLYIADIGDGAGHVRRVDLSANTIDTVAGGGSRFVTDGKAADAKLLPTKLAVDYRGRLYVADANQCAIFQVETPAVIAPTPPPSAPVGPSPPTTVQTGGGAEDPSKNLGQTAPATNADPVGGQAGAVESPRTEIISSSPANPQTEIVSSTDSVTAPGPAGQSTPQQGTAPGFGGEPAAAPNVNPTPTPTAAADAGTIVVSDPGPSGAAAPDASAAVPPAPAAAPVPPTPASAPPPAAQQPVSSPGLVHGDNGVPGRGATRYAMVRNDEEQSLAAALAMAGAGAGLAVFLCVMFVAPGASSKPKPRPKGAY